MQDNSPVVMEDVIDMMMTQMLGLPHFHPPMWKTP